MKRVIVALMLLTLAACSTRQPAAPEWEAQRGMVTALEEWDFKGRMAVKVEDDPDASGQLNVIWAQARDISRIRLSGPFGAGAWSLLWEPERVSVTDAEGERSIEYTGPDAAADFMHAELGWEFPADSLRYWVRGLPDPSSIPVLRWSDAGTLEGLQQHGWEIAYTRYGNFDDLLLPTRITIEGRGVRIRMVISKWQFGSADG